MNKKDRQVQLFIGNQQRQNDLSLSVSNRRLHAVETREINDTGWIALPFFTGWQNYSPNNNWEEGEYRKINNVVYIKGLIERDSGSLLTIATLPVNFRPLNGNIRLITYISDGAHKTAHLTIGTDGIITVLSHSSFDWVSMNVSFAI